MHRTAISQVVFAGLNAPLALLGVIGFVLKPSVGGALAMLLLGVGPVASIVFVVRTTRAAAQGETPPGGYLRPAVLMWNLGLLGGMVIPYLVQNGLERAGILYASLGGVAILNALLAALPRLFIGGNRALDSGARAA